MSAEVAADVANLADLCRRQATVRGEERAFVFLESGVVESASITYAELDRRACAIAARLRSLAVPGSRALLCHPPGIEFVAAFVGCLYAGIIAVPAPPVSSSADNPIRPSPPRCKSARRLSACFE